MYMIFFGVKRGNNYLKNYPDLINTKKNILGDIKL